MDRGQLRQTARQRRRVQPELQSFFRGRGRGDITFFQEQEDVTEILGNKDETSLLRPRSQTDAGGIFAQRAGAGGYDLEH
jgi:hypothetical protein